MVGASKPLQQQKTDGMRIKGEIMYVSGPWAISEWIQNPESLLQDEW